MRKLDEFTKKILHPEQDISSQVQERKENTVNIERESVGAVFCGARRDADRLGNCGV